MPSSKELFLFLYFLSEFLAFSKADSAVIDTKLFSLGSRLWILSKKELTKSTEENSNFFKPSNCCLIDNSNISVNLFISFYNFRY